jgi:DNA-binding GntR family transcriptional regulator
MSSTGISKYLEIKEQIEKQISDGKYPLGKFLPSEPNLTELYNASRGTIRQALSALERDGTVARQSGLGTKVINRPSSARILSFSERIAEMGKEASTRLLSKKLIPITEAEEKVYDAFVFNESQAARVLVYRIDRLRLADEIPVAHQVIFIKEDDFGPDFLERADFEHSAFKIYEQRRRHPTWATETIKARLATDEEVHLLKMESLLPTQRLVYIRNRITYDSENLPLEVLCSVDRVDFFTEYSYRLVSEDSENRHRKS